MSTRTCFEKEAKDNLEMAYWIRVTLRDQRVKMLQCISQHLHRTFARLH